MEPAFSVFVRDLQDQTLCVTVRESSTLEDVKLQVEDRSGIPAAEQLLTPLTHYFACDALLSELKIRPGSLLQLSGRLRGGKGGFGSLLRGSRKASQTENEDACRDLSGRRIRVASAEQKLQEWAAAEEQRKLDKQAAKEERERAKAERRAENAQVDTEALRKEQSAAFSSLQKALDSSIKAGAKRGAQPAAKPATKKPRYQSESEDEEDEDAASSDSEDDLPSASAKPAPVDSIAVPQKAVESLPVASALQEAVG